MWRTLAQYPHKKGIISWYLSRLALFTNTSSDLIVS